MGLSRNKVAVSEGAAGSPPFYGDRDRRSARAQRNDRSSKVENKNEKGTNGNHGQEVQTGFDAYLCSVRTSVIQLSGTNDKTLYGGVAQLGEHLPCKQGVKGSIPFISTTGKRRRHARGRFGASLKHITRWETNKNRIKPSNVTNMESNGIPNEFETVCSSGG